MLYSYNTNSQAVNVNGNIAFDDNWVLTRRCNYEPVISHQPGSVSISLNAPGLYYVAFNADATTPVAAGDVSVQLYDNNEVVPGAKATESSTTTSTVNLAFSNLVRVCPNCASVCNNVPAVLTVKSIGVAATFTNVGITVTKVG